MYLRSTECFCVALCFLGVRSQRNWDFNSGDNSVFSNSWNPGFSASNVEHGESNMPNAFENEFEDLNTFTNNKPSKGSGSTTSWFLNFSRRPSEGIDSFRGEANSDLGYESASRNDKMSSETSSKWQSHELEVKPNEKAPNFIINSPSSFKGKANSNKVSFNSDINANSVSWESEKSPLGLSNNQNLKPKDWNSNTIYWNKLNSNTFNNENDVFVDTNYEDNSVVSTGNSNNKQKLQPTFTAYGGSPRWEPTIEKSSKYSKALKSELSFNNTLQKHNNWNLKIPLKPEKEKNPVKPNIQAESKPTNLDTSILDELDVNDWYFGKESNYPKSPFRSILNINTSELWYFDKNKKFNSDFKNKSHKSSNKRKSRHIGILGDAIKDIQCECVNVNSCDKGMIITQDDVHFYSRPLETFKCESLRKVCCTKPKKSVSTKANFHGEKAHLKCGKRRTGENRFKKFKDNIAEPGEFPWMLTLENAQINCSASLIHRKLALTAAHCITGALANKLILKAGVWNSNNENFQTRKITRIIPHPNFNIEHPRNDIAILVVEEPFELTENVNPVCLPTANDKWDSSQCVVAGWRPETIGGQVIKVLAKGVMNFLPQEECQNIILVTDLWRNYILHESFVCGLEKTRPQLCTENEGSFLICPSKKQPNIYLQTGLVSKNVNCDKFGRPGIFTNVLKFLDWINENYFELELSDDTDFKSPA